MSYPYLALTEKHGKAYRCVLFELDEDNGAAMVRDIAEADDINRAIVHIFNSEPKTSTILPKVDHDTDGAVRFGNHYGLLLTSRAAVQRWLAERPYDYQLPVYNTQGVIDVQARIRNILLKAGLTRNEQHDAVHGVLMDYNDLA